SFLSRYTLAWWLGRFPEQRAILASYGADLAFHWSAKAKQTLESHGRRLFGVEGHGNADAWGIVGGEVAVKAGGGGGRVTGLRADLLPCDDLLKNYEEAQSEVVREATWEWFLSTAYTRLEPNGVAIVIASRWHEDDPIGRIQSRMATGEMEPWEVFN